MQPAEYERYAAGQGYIGRRMGRRGQREDGHLYTARRTAAQHRHCVGA